MNTITTERWTVARAQVLFTESENNQDMAIVDADNKSAAHWYRRYRKLIDEYSVPRMTAYDTIAVRSQKSPRTIRYYVRVFEQFGEDVFEQYPTLGITYLTAAITRLDIDEFLAEAVAQPNTTVDTLLAEFEADDGDETPRDKPPYHRRLWSVARAVATLPNGDKAEAQAHLAALNGILERNGVE